MRTGAQQIRSRVISRLKSNSVAFATELMWLKALLIRLLHQQDWKCFRLSRIKFMQRQEK